MKQLISMAFAVLFDFLSDRGLVKQRAAALAKIYVTIQGLAEDVPELAAEIERRGGSL